MRGLPRDTGPPKDRHSAAWAYVTSQGKRGFADVIKVTGLQIRGGISELPSKPRTFASGDRIEAEEGEVKEMYACKRHSAFASFEGEGPM